MAPLYVGSLASTRKGKEGREEGRKETGNSFVNQVRVLAGFGGVSKNPPTLSWKNHLWSLVGDRNISNHQFAKLSYTSSVINPNLHTGSCESPCDGADAGEAPTSQSRSLAQLRTLSWPPSMLAFYIFKLWLHFRTKETFWRREEKKRPYVAHWDGQI